MGSFLGIKRPECEFDLSPPSSAEVKNEWSSNSPPLYVYMKSAGTIFSFVSTLGFIAWNVRTVAIYQTSAEI
jgi:hypothetical protein